MAAWMKYVLGICVPLMVFMVLQDTVGGFYGTRSAELSYVVVETEDASVVEEEATSEEPVEEATSEVASEDAEAEAPEEDVASTDAPETTDETAEVTEPTDDAPEEGSEAEMVAGLSPDEMDAGERAARACASCHQFERERNAVGPHLVGVVGRAIGSIEGFRYSEALQALNAEGAVWSAEELEIWLEDPDAYAPGTKMMYQVPDAEDRRLIAGWLAYRAE